MGVGKRDDQREALQDKHSMKKDMEGSGPVCIRQRCWASGVVGKE